MEPVFVDIHIHTSENPNLLNEAYDVKELLKNVEKIAGNHHLIALSDHNTINKAAYLNLLELTEGVILAAELHIQNYKTKPPYHCHILFNVSPIAAVNIDEINKILDELYPNKVIAKEETEVPSISDIVNGFDKYEFLLLPHGGQSHSTFDKSIPTGVIFDTTLERSIYYNQFDGFTARSNDGLEDTQLYFNRLGIKDFVNLLTCSDNYNPRVYPQAKDPEASRFLPTWMFASPTFEGLRLSLSEASRFTYSDTKPESWAEYIGKVFLHNENISVDVNLLPGLNVVIGGPSSGKTLFVDSVYRKTCDDFADSNYKQFDIENIQIVNPANLKPHYINQNFIMSVLSNEERGIDEIDMVNKVFPIDEEIDRQIQAALADVKADVYTLINGAQKLEDGREELSRVPTISRLIIEGSVKQNIISLFLPDPVDKLKYTLKPQKYDEYVNNLKEIGNFLINNPFCNDIAGELRTIEAELTRAYEISQFEGLIYKIISGQKKTVDEQLKGEDLERQSKTQELEKLYRLFGIYIESEDLLFNTR